MKGNRWVPGRKGVNTKKIWAAVCFEAWFTSRWRAKTCPFHSLWGGSQEPMGTEMMMTFSRTVREKHHNISVSFSHSGSHAISLHHKHFLLGLHSECTRKQGKKWAITVSLRLPSLLQPHRRQCIITANTVTQVSLSPCLYYCFITCRINVFYLWPVT